MSASVDTEMMLWRAHAKLGEEYVRHIGVEVLAGMDHYFGKSDLLRQRGRYDTGLDELGGELPRRSESSSSGSAYFCSAACSARTM